MPDRLPDDNEFDEEPELTTALVNIGSLVTNDPLLGDGPLGLVTDAAIVIEGGRIIWVGPSSECGPADEQVDLEGRAVLPGFVDSHAHLLFAGDRSAEFAARMSGQPYSAGGIHSTVQNTRNADDAGPQHDDAHQAPSVAAVVYSGSGMQLQKRLRSP